MATPPTRVSFGASAYNTTTTPKTVSITVQTGDRIVVISVAESMWDGAVNTPPTGGSLTYTQVASVGIDNDTARAIAWTATATSAATLTVSAVNPATRSTLWWGFMVWVYRGSDGFGAVGAPTANSTSNSVTLTTTGANSAIVGAHADWNATDGTTRTRRTVNSSTGTEDAYFRDASRYAIYGQHYDDAGAAGSKTVGYSAPTGQATGSIVVEVYGTTGGIDGTVTANPATATAAALPPAVTATQNFTVLAVTTTALATMPPPAVAAGASVNIAPPTATSSAIAPSPTVSAVRQASVTSPRAIAMAELVAPELLAESVISGGGPATATATLRPPTVTGTRSATVAAVPATAAAAVPSPAVTVTGLATVIAVRATATAAARAPVARGSATVAAPKATATATCRPPHLGAERRNIIITGVTEPATSWLTTEAATQWAGTDPTTAWGHTEPAGTWTHTEPALLQTWVTTEPTPATAMTEPVLAYTATEPAL